MKKSFLNSRFFKVIIFIIILFLVAEITGIRDQFSVKYIQEVFHKNIVLSIIIYLGLFILGNFLQIPGGVFLLGAILAIGKFQGWALAYFSAVISCMVTYFVIGFFARGSLDKVPNKIIDRFIGKIEERPIQTIIILRLLLQSAPVLNYTLAATNVKAKDYFLGTLLGLPLGILAWVYFLDYLTMLYR